MGLSPCSQALVAAARVFLSKHRVKEPSLNVSMDRGIRLDLDSDSESEDGAGCSSRKVPWDERYIYRIHVP